MEEFDENKDNRISVRELTAVLPVEESFFVLFRSAVHADKGVDYMKIWKKYDKDGSGYIEVNELKAFLKDLIAKSNIQSKVDEKQLTDYAQTILTLFDINNDGKLGLQELIGLLPDRENFVKLALDRAHFNQQLKQSDIDKLLDKYDRDNSGTLEGAELQNLVRDILDDQSAIDKTNYDANDVFEVEKALLKGCDVDKNGRIDRKELAVVLITISRAGISGLFQGIDEYAGAVHSNSAVKK